MMNSKQNNTDLPMSKKKSKYKMTDSDCQPMQLWQKGQILYLHHQGFTKRDISGVVGKSMEWVEIIIGALSGCDIEQQLIDKYHEREEQKENVAKRKTTTTESKCKRRVRYTSKRTANKKDSSPIRWGKIESVRRNNDGQCEVSDVPRQRKRAIPDTSPSLNKKRSVIDKLKDNKDYVE